LQKELSLINKTKEMNDVSTQNLQALKAYWQAYNKHDLESILLLFDENIIIHFPTNPQPIHGKSNIQKVWTLLFTKAIPDIHEQVLSIFVNNDMGACQVIETGTLNIPPEIEQTMNMEPAVRSYQIPIGSFFHFNEQGLIDKISAYWDTAIFSQQVGVNIEIIRAMQNNAQNI
jgi:ketosteroid isomerase-like protein